MQLAQLGIIGSFGSSSGPTNTGSSVPDGATFDLDEMIMWIDVANTTTMLQEQATASVPVTEVLNDGDAVGTMYVRGYHTHVMYSDITGNRPLLASDGTRFSYLAFSSNNFSIENSIKFFSKANYDNQIFSVMGWVRRTVDGAIQLTLTNKTSALTTVEVGFTIQMTAANKLRYQGTKNSSGNAIWDITSTVSIVVADGWVPYFLEINGSGTGKGRLIIGNNSADTFNVAAGVTSDPTGNVKISGTGSLGPIIMLNRVLTNDDIAWWKTYNPTRVAINFNPVLQWDLNPDQSSRLFSDVAETTTITDGTAIRSWISDETSIFGNLNRKLTNSGSGPVWRQSAINSKAGVEFDGSGTNPFSFSSNLTRERGGKYTIFLVVKNERADPGSHFLTGSEYVTFTGSDYASGPITDEYFTIHTNNLGVAATNTVPLKNQSNSANVVAFRRDRGTFSQWSQLKIKFDAVNSEYLLLNQMGVKNSALVANWHTDGFVYRLIKYNGIMTDAEVTAKIDELTTLYNT